MFVLRLHERDEEILLDIKNNLNCGYKKKTQKNMMDYIISDKKNLYNIIIPIFEKYPLLTKKYYQYEEWKNLLKKRILNKEFIRIRNPYKLTANVENSIEEIKIKPYFKNWLIGFIQGDGSFNRRKDGKRIIPEFGIAQKYDNLVLEAIRQTLGINSKILVRKCGTIYVLQTKSKKDICKIYEFIKNSEVNLKSYHLKRFNIWLQN